MTCSTEFLAFSAHTPTGGFFVSEIGQFDGFCVHITQAISRFAWPVDPLPPPKNWRWFHAFRQWSQPARVKLEDGMPQRIRRIQERRPIVQRCRQKRRQFVQACRKGAA